MRKFALVVCAMLVVMPMFVLTGCFNEPEYFTVNFDFRAGGDVQVAIGGTPVTHTSSHKEGSELTITVTPNLLFETLSVMAGTTALTGENDIYKHTLSGNVTLRARFLSVSASVYSFDASMGMIDITDEVLADGTPSIEFDNGTILLTTYSNVTHQMETNALDYTMDGAYTYIISEQEEFLGNTYALEMVVVRDGTRLTVDMTERSSILDAPEVKTVRFMEFESSSGGNLYLMTRALVPNENGGMVFRLRTAGVAEITLATLGSERSFTGSYTVNGTKIRLFDEFEDLMFEGVFIRNAIQVDLTDTANNSEMVTLLTMLGVTVDGDILTINRQLNP